MKISEWWNTVSPEMRVNDAGSAISTILKVLAEYDPAAIGLGTPIMFRDFEINTSGNVSNIARYLISTIDGTSNP